jgi:hypothetical protein
MGAGHSKGKSEQRHSWRIYSIHLGSDAMKWKKRVADLQMEEDKEWPQCCNME